tara:strand:+ start:593 stop:802 length:210 start_codon:yes stop_codon:yes gene_type:complete
MNDLKFEDICNQWYNGNRKHTFELMLENNFDDANTIIDEYLKMPIRFISWNDIVRITEGVILLKNEGEV